MNWKGLVYKGVARGRGEGEGGSWAANDDPMVSLFFVTWRKTQHRDGHENLVSIPCLIQCDPPPPPPPFEKSWLRPSQRIMKIFFRVPGSPRKFPMSFPWLGEKRKTWQWVSQSQLLSTMTQLTSSAFLWCVHLLWKISCSFHELLRHELILQLIVRTCCIWEGCHLHWFEASPYSSYLRQSHTSAWTAVLRPLLDASWRQPTYQTSRENNMVSCLRLDDANNNKNKKFTKYTTSTPRSHVHSPY